MADESDVEVALVAAAAAAIYPDGPSGASRAGSACRIIRGEPNAEALNADLAAGVVNVTVTLLDKMSRNTTRYATGWQAAAVMPAALPLSVSMAGNLASFAGSGGAGAIVGVRASGQAVTYVPQAGDTPASVAAALARRIAGAVANGAVLSLPVAGGTPLAVVYGFTEAISETRRQEQGFAVTILAPTPDARTATGCAIDGTFAGIDFLMLADGSAGRLRYRGTQLDDVPSRANLWRRELLYTVEYGTTAVVNVPDMVVGSLELNAAPAGSITQ